MPSADVVSQQGEAIVRSEARYRRILALVGAVALLVVYAGSFGNGFHYDDFHSIVENRAIRDPGNIPAFFTDPAMPWASWPT